MSPVHDHRGKPSATRLAALACALTACASVLLPMFGHGETPDLGTLGALLGGGFGAKVWQARIEHGNRSEETS